MTKRLTKSNTNKVISGVCGGIAEYFNIDPAIVRIIWVLLSFGGGSGLIIYIVCIFILPDAPTYHAPPPDFNNHDPNQGNWNN